MSSADHPIVEFSQSNRTPLYVSLRGPLEVGRECDGVLLADPQVSRRHLLLEVSPEGAVIATDLGSTNGSTMNGVALRNPTPLRVGSIIRCGETTIRLEPPPTTGRVTTVATPEPLFGEDDDSVVAVTAETRVGALADEPSDAPGAGGPRPGDDFRQTSIDIVAASAAGVVVDVGALADDQGTVTVVFSDIESSTARNVALGDQVWSEVLAEHDEIVSERVARHGGTIVEHQRDGFMLSFPGARSAVDCMATVQRDLRARAGARPERKVRIRVGMHTGEVVAADEGDLFGQHVVVAARVANLAEGGEILVSSPTREIVASHGDVVFGAPRSVMLEGIGDAVVHPIDWAHT